MFGETGFQVDVQEVTYENPSHEWTHTINLYCTWYLETAWLAAIQGAFELFMFLFSLYGESGIMNYDTRLFIPACYICSMDTNKLKIFVVEDQK